MKISIKRVYEQPSDADGYRILIDRLWPRGLTKEKAVIDTWLKQLAPTPALRKWFDHRPERFIDFRRKYLLELQQTPAVAEVMPLLPRKKLTLVYGAKDPKINHAVILADFLSGKNVSND